MEKYGFCLAGLIILFAILSGLRKSRKSSKGDNISTHEHEEEYLNPIVKGKLEKLERENEKLRKQNGYATYSSAVDTAAKIYVTGFKLRLIVLLFGFIVILLIPIL